LAGQPAPRTRVLHTVEVALEAQPVRVGVLADPPVPGADRTGRARRQHRSEVGLPLLAPPEPPADEGIGVAMGALHGDALLDDHRIHDVRVPGRCDGYADAAGPPGSRGGLAGRRFSSRYFGMKRPSTSSRENPNVICVRSFVPNEKNSATSAMSWASRAARGVSTIVPTRNDTPSRVSEKSASATSRTSSTRYFSSG